MLGWLSSFRCRPEWRCTFLLYKLKSMTPIDQPFGYQPLEHIIIARLYIDNLGHYRFATRAVETLLSSKSVLAAAALRPKWKTEVMGTSSPVFQDSNPDMCSNIVLVGILLIVSGLMISWRHGASSCHLRISLGSGVRLTNRGVDNDLDVTKLVSVGCVQGSSYERLSNLPSR